MSQDESNELVSDVGTAKQVDVPKCWNWTDADLDVHDQIVAERAASRAILENGDPFLGLATTKQLIDELNFRAQVAQTNGEDWLNYRTVDGGFSVDVEILDSGSPDSNSEINPAGEEPQTNHDPIKHVIQPGDLPEMRFVGDKNQAKEQ